MIPGTDPRALVNVLFRPEVPAVAITKSITPTARLRRRLEALGYEVRSFSLPTGHYRSSPYADVVRWEARVVAPGAKMESTIASWDTVTACARGFVVGDVGMSGHIEVHAKAAKTA